MNPSRFPCYKMEEENAVFFYRWQLKPNFWNAKGDRLSTVRIWDRPTWNREQLNLPLLRQVLEKVAVDSISLEIVCQPQCSWSQLEDSLWLKFCETIQCCLPNLRILHLHSPQFFGDAKCKVLLEHLPTELTHLELAFTREDQPLTLHQFCTSFPKLEELKIVEYDMLSVAGSEILTESLRQLCQLKKVTLRSMTSENVEDVWRPVFAALRSNRHLEEVTITGVWHNYLAEAGEQEARKESVCWLTEETEALQFGPRLNQAKKKFLSGKSLTKGDFVRAIVSVRDRLDCLDYLLSGVDPNLYAQQAVRDENELLITSRK